MWCIEKASSRIIWNISPSQYVLCMNDAGHAHLFVFDGLYCLLKRQWNFERAYLIKQNHTPCYDRADWAEAHSKIYYCR
jgi:hypothetical protein